ncbi:MAG: metal ABC transporter permease [Saprospiraceae bacterium]|nr:metal ABC transporter permease [Saprospiraceae bacterium]
MVNMIDILSQPWALRALLASIMVGVMCGILGCFIVLRNMALIGDALSHAILPGIVVAFMIFGYSTLGFFTGSVIAGLLAAIFITWIQQRVQTKNDAAIGIVFTAMFSLGVIGISWISKEQGVHLDLKDFLFGNVLGVSDEDLYLTLGITIYVIVSVIIFYRYLFISTFQPVIAQAMGISTRLIHYFVMLLLSFAVVASLRTVGVILVVAMLITPASTALLISNRLKQVISLAALIGMFAAVVGLVLAIVFDTTPGPAMAIVATLVYLFTALFSPTKGLVFEYFRSRHQRQRIRMEDILKQSFRLQTDGSLSFAQLMTKIDIEKSQLRKLLRKLTKKGYLTTSNQSITINDSGLAEATRLIRAHRLWETFLVDQIGLNEEQIHEEAEKYEHLLTDEILDEVDRELGYPTTDPHGSPIPSRKGSMIKSLWQLKPEEDAIISKTQPNQLIAVDLWKLGLLPGSVVRVTSVKKDKLQIESSGMEYDIVQSLALNINIEKISGS